MAILAMFDSRSKSRDFSGDRCCVGVRSVFSALSVARCGRFASSNQPSILAGMTRDEICSKFLETVTFDLYPLQEDALLARFGQAACYADCDPNGVLDIFDFLCFQNSFVAGEPYACDCNPDPACDIFDFPCFQTAFVGGCP